MTTLDARSIAKQLLDLAGLRTKDNVAWVLSNMDPNYDKNSQALSQTMRSVASKAQNPAKFMEMCEVVRKQGFGDLAPLLESLQQLMNPNQLDNAELAKTPLPPGKQRFSYLLPSARKELENVRLTMSPSKVSLPFTRKSLIPKEPEWLKQRGSLTPRNTRPMHVSGSKGTGGASGGNKENAHGVLPPKAAHAGAVSQPTMGSMPVCAQEKMILKEVLFALLGVSTEHISLTVDICRRARSSDAQFKGDYTIDTSLKNLLDHILPICLHYARVVQYLDKHNTFVQGTVVHSLCAAIRQITKEYLVFVAQVEGLFRKGDLTLQALWFQVQPAMNTLSLLDTLVLSARQITGAAILNLLHSKYTSMAGDASARDLYLYLIQHASMPYFELLEKWIFKGIIEDPYDEFMVEENEEYKKETLSQDYNNAYWEKRYTLKPERVPTFLSHLSTKILTAGKYLNVIRESGQPIVSPQATTMLFTESDSEYVDTIDRAYEYGSQQLLQLLMKDRDLMGILGSIKHYFLMERGDFFIHFLDTAGEELQKKVSNVSRSRLESLLDLSVRSSSCNDDVYKDNLSCHCSPFNLADQLLVIIQINGASTVPDLDVTKQIMACDHKDRQCLEALTFDYKIEWPLSIVLSRKALWKYQLLQRHLLQCKHVEYQLNQSWERLQLTRKHHLRTAFMTTYVLSQRMHYFMQNYVYYMLGEVVDPNYHRMEANLKKSRSLDEVLQYHDDFLDTCLKECMLTNERLVKNLNRVIQTCSMFSLHVNETIDSLLLKCTDSMDSGSVRNKKGKDTDVRTKALDRQQRIDKASEAFTKEINSGNYYQITEKFEETFDRLLGKLIKNLNGYSQKEGQQMTNLSIRLDYNGYYSSSN